MSSDLKFKTILPQSSLDFIPEMLEIIRKLDPRVQEAFAPLIEAYVNGVNWYDETMDFTGFNFRYASHPYTNLSEMLAMHWLLKDDTVINVRVETDKNGQCAGIDLIADTIHGPLLINVKSADMPPIGPDGKEARYFDLHPEVYTKLKSQYKRCDRIVLVDVTRLAIFALNTASMEEDGYPGAYPVGSRQRQHYDYFVNRSEYCAEILEELL